MKGKRSRCVRGRGRWMWGLCVCIRMGVRDCKLRGCDNVRGCDRVRMR